jgi:predicted negative regulator of RcsB-dependent stress response
MKNHELDLQEQEQIANLKAFWDRYGGFITTIVTLALLSYAAFNGWRYWQFKQARQAVVVYEAVEKAAADRDLSALKTAVGSLVDEYKGTAYASKGALIAARSFFESNDPRQAKAQLQWVVDHGFSDAYKATARIRLAGLLLDEKAYDDGLKLLDFSVPLSHAGLVSDRVGDLQAAKDNRDAARKAYSDALTQLEERDPWRAVVQLKLEALAP